jgi:hypothetical protein
MPNETPSTIDRAFAAHLSAMAIKRRYSDQSCNFTTIELPQLGHLRQQ